MSHHPSCRPTDRNLFWYCSQCGTNEPAEEEILARLVRQRKAFVKYGGHLAGCKHRESWASNDSTSQPPGCTCGFTAALAQDAHRTEATG